MLQGLVYVSRRVLSAPALRGFQCLGFKVCLCKGIHIRICTHTCIYTYICVYIYMSFYIHVCIKIYVSYTCRSSAKGVEPVWGCLGSAQGPILTHENLEE